MTVVEHGWVRVEREVSGVIGLLPKTAPKKHGGRHGSAMAEWKMVPRKTEVALVHFARGLAWSWVTSETMVNHIVKPKLPALISRLRE